MTGITFDTVYAGAGTVAGQFLAPLAFTAGMIILAAFVAGVFTVLSRNTAAKSAFRKGRPAQAASASVARTRGEVNR